MQWGFQGGQGASSGHWAGVEGTSAACISHLALFLLHQPAACKWCWQCTSAAAAASTCMPYGSFQIAAGVRRKGGAGPLLPPSHARLAGHAGVCSRSLPALLHSSCTPLLLLLLLTTCQGTSYSMPQSAACRCMSQLSQGMTTPTLKPPTPCR